MMILGLDLGLKRIGAAIADGEMIVSLDTIDSENRDEAVAQILKICREEQVDKIVLGISKNQADGKDEAEDMVRSFAMELNKNIDIPIAYIDETLTSQEAARILKDLKIDPKSAKYKQEIDRISAKLILEQYLNNHE